MQNCIVFGSAEHVLKCLPQELQFASCAPAARLVETERRWSCTASERVGKRAAVPPALLARRRWERGTTGGAERPDGWKWDPLNAQLFISTPLAHIWQLRPAAGHSHFSALDAQGTATAEVTQTKLSSSRPSSVHLTSIARATTTPLSRCWLLESSWALPGPQQVSMQQQRKQGATVHHLPGGLGSLGLEKKENDYKPEPPPLLWPRDGPRQHSLCTCNKSDLLCACQHTP